MREEGIYLRCKGLRMYRYKQRPSGPQGGYVQGTGGFKTCPKIDRDTSNELYLIRPNLSLILT